MRSFFWLIDGVLAGCGRPGFRGAGGRGPGGPGGGRRPALDDTPEALAALEADLVWLREQGIGAVLSLTETPLVDGAAERLGLAVLHLPVDDLTAPTPRQLEHALAFIDEQTTRGRGVAVHCLMGQGRSATVLAAYLIRAGATPEAAIALMRGVCHGAIGSPEQERALHAFARRRDWIV
jgi:atypical dual specificity phosphatase